MVNVAMGRDCLDKSGKSLNPSLEPKEVMLEEAR
jgi:hypothetical protein